MELKELLAFIILGGIISAIITTCIPNRDLRKEAISRGFAEYNQTNGNWQWKSSPPPAHLTD